MPFLIDFGAENFLQYRQETPIVDSTASTVLSAQPEIELLDTELTGDFNTGFNFTGRVIEGNTPINEFECSLNNAEYTSCSPPVKYSLVTGNYTLEVRSVSNGTVDQTPAVVIGSVQ